MSDNWDAVVSEMNQWNLGIVEQNPKRLAQVLSSYIIKGSALHQLNASEIIVYENIDDEFPGKEKVETSGEGNGKLATTVDGLMAAGAKFFDAVFFISMKKELRPKALKHNFDENSKTEKKIPVYNDKSKLIRYLFSYYFFIMIRAHPPTDIGDYRDQPMPKFITTVMAMKETMAEMAEYLAEFDLSKVDPGWVRLLDAKGLGQETASRLGLGVAGYRLPSIFNLIIPDMYIETPKEEKEQGDKDFKTVIKIKPQWFDDAILVAQSFRSAGFCWDFHPATRSPNVLAKYGNINKNITNLILEAYKPETIQMMIQTKKLAKMPVMDPSYTNYKTWNKNMVYVATSKIFK